MMRLAMLIGLLLVASFAHSENEWATMFDGRQGDGSLDGWLQSGPGGFVMDKDGSIKSQGGMGLFYYAEQSFEDFELEVEWRVENGRANSGIFVRFPSAETPWSAVEGGYEIQIDDSAPAQKQTGGIYDFAAPSKLASLPVGQWNKYQIKVVGQHYSVRLNGELVTEFFGERALRGFIGLQNHDPKSTTWFRLVRARAISEHVTPLKQVVAAFANDEDVAPIKVLTVTATHGYRHGPAIEQAKELLPMLGEVSEFQFDITEDLNDLSAENLAQYDVLFFANSTLRVDVPDVVQETVLTFRAGDWRNYDALIHVPSQDIPVRVALSGTPPELTGMVEFQNVATEIDEIVLQGSDLSMRWQGSGGLGEVEAKLVLTDDGFAGTLAVEDQQIPVDAKTVDAAQREQWVVQDPLTQAHRDAIVGFLRQGKGIAGAHSALDALYGWSEYREMVGGGLFAEHPWTQSVRVVIEDPTDPSVSHFGDAFEVRDEIYVLDKNPRWNSHVLASLDTRSVGIEQGPPDVKRNDFPISWVREHNGGRVFMTKLGHFPDVWTNPGFIQHLLQGLRIAAGRIDGAYGGHRVKETIADNVWPDDIAVDEIGNVWIAELRGKVHRYDAASGETQLVAQLPTTDPTKIEHGLLGIEIDPNFHEGEPYIYMFYTERETFINTLSRFTYDGSQLDLESELVLLRVPTDPMCCHQAGDLEWGLDGSLFISTGDTGMSETKPTWEISEQQVADYESRNNLDGHHWSRIVDSERSAQNLQDLRGKILRINKDGTIPTDNPFVGEPGVRWEIYAYGLRNPYRFKVHPKTGALLIGVVGPDARYDYDEYNIAANGGENFGWPRSIGRLFYNDWAPEDIPNYTPPLWEYTYATGARSATVGPIYDYKGVDGFPSAFHGKVFLFDWSRRWIKWAELDQGHFTNDAEASVKKQPLAIDQLGPRLVNIKDFDTFSNTTPISMELGPDGSLYVAEFDGFWDAGPNAKVSRYRWVHDAQASSSQIDEASNVAASANETPGQSIYESRCASCHQGEGQGVAGVFPPLAGVDWVTGNAEKLIDVVLNGLSGEIEVNGERYSGVMAPWRESLSDKEISELLTFLRSSWGNSASPVSSKQVMQQR